MNSFSFPKDLAEFYIGLLSKNGQVIEQRYVSPHKLYLIRYTYKIKDLLGTAQIFPCLFLAS